MRYTSPSQQGGRQFERSEPWGWWIKSICFFRCIGMDIPRFMVFLRDFRSGGGARPDDELIK